MRRLIAALVISGAGFLLAATSSAANDHWSQGLAAFNEGSFDIAAEHFEAVTETNPSWPGGYYMLGRCHTGLGNTTAAIEMLTKAHELDPKDADTVVALGEALVAAGEPVADVSSLLESLPEELQSRAAAQLASVLVNDGKAAAAEAILLDCVAKNQEDPQLFRLLGQSQKSQGLIDRAFVSFSRAFTLDSDEASARAAIQSAFALAETEPDPVRQQQWFDHALEVSEALVEVVPTSENHRTAGQAAFAAHELENAVRHFRVAVKLDENDPKTLYLLGRTLVTLDREAEAEDVYSEALTKAPDDKLARLLHGQLGRLAACRLDLNGAAAHYRLADRPERAAEIEKLAAEFSDALAQLDKLKSTIAEIRGMEKELEALGDEQGVAAMQERAAVHQSEVNALEANLEDVRSALCQ